MSAGDLYQRNLREIARLKRIRRERLRPVRAFIAALPCSLRLSSYDSEKCSIDGGTFDNYEVDLTKPLDRRAILDHLYDCLDTREEWLDAAREKVDRVEAALDAEERGGQTSDTKEGQEAVEVASGD